MLNINRKKTGTSKWQILYDKSKCLSTEQLSTCTAGNCTQLILNTSYSYSITTDKNSEKKAQTKQKTDQY